MLLTVFRGCNEILQPERISGMRKLTSLSSRFHPHCQRMVEMMDARRALSGLSRVSVGLIVQEPRTQSKT